MSTNLNNVAFSTNRNAVAAEAKRLDASVVTIRVEGAPIWRAGDIVAEATGRFPAVRYSTSPAGEAFYAVLLTDGTFSAVASWNVLEAR